MAKKHLPKANHQEEVDIIIESQQWESPTPPRFTWRHGLILALILGVAILFAFGFLVIAGIVLLSAIIVQIFLFIIRKIT